VLDAVAFADTVNVALSVGSVDWANAYDRVDRQLHYATLQDHGVGPMMIHLIEELHEDGKGMVLINGWLSKPFPVDSGVRQGDPSAPIVYVYSAQPLISLSTGGWLLGLTGAPVPTLTQVPGQPPRWTTSLRLVQGQAPVSAHPRANAVSINVDGDRRLDIEPGRPAPDICTRIISLVKAMLSRLYGHHERGEAALAAATYADDSNFFLNGPWDAVRLAFILFLWIQATGAGVNWRKGWIMAHIKLTQVHGGPTPNSRGLIHNVYGACAFHLLMIKSSPPIRGLMNGGWGFMMLMAPAVLVAPWTSIALKMALCLSIMHYIMASISMMSSWFQLRWLSHQWTWIGPGQSVRLLGVDVGLSGPKPVDEQGVLARVNGAIQRWRRLNMSDAGRVHIANSEVLSRIWYTALQPSSRQPHRHSTSNFGWQWVASSDAAPTSTP